MLAACGRGDPPAPQVARAATGVAVFGDSHPHDWVGRAPWHYAVHGVDVSRYQGDIDWSLVRRSNISFAYIKATEGGDVADEMFATNWVLARAAGMPRGAYHYYYFCRSPEEQARWFMEHVPVDPSALPPVLDIEWTHKSKTCRFRPEPEEVREMMGTFLATLTRRYGKRPVIYSTVDFYADNELWNVRGYDFWLRSVAGHPSVTYPAQDWMFWQYTGTGIVPGIEGRADINAFVGSAGDFARWASR
jgi:lysozyme